MYSPEFPFSVYPVRPGVYQVFKISRIWHYSYWSGRSWAMTTDTATSAADESAPSWGIYAKIPAYTHWRGLSSPSSEA